MKYNLNLKLKNFDFLLTTLFGVFYLFGVILFNFKPTFIIIQGLSELFLYFCAAGFFLAIYLSYRYQSKFNFNSFFVFSAITFVATLVIEMIGTATGVIFGSYTYGKVLSLQIFNTPLIIGFNWLILIVCCCEIARALFNYMEVFKSQSNWVKYIITSIISVSLITFFDFIMEPIAVYFGYWNWGSKDIYLIPLQNYVAWFVIGFIFSIFYLFINIEIKSSFVKNIFWLQLLFFTFLRLSLFLN